MNDSVQDRFSNFDFGTLTEDPVVKSTMGQAMNENPDDHANALNLSDRTGIPINAVKDDVSAVEVQDRFSSFDFNKLSKESPKTATFMEKYDNAAVVHDDTKNLGEIEKIFSGLGESIGIGFENLIDGAQLQSIDQSMQHAQRFVDDPNNSENVRKLFQRGLDSRAEKAIGLLESIRTDSERRDEITPSDMNVVQEGVRAGIESLPVMGASVAFGALTRTGTAGVLGAMGINAMGTSYASARDQGLSPVEAFYYSQIKAVIEAGTEALPLKSLVDIATGIAKKGLSKKLAVFVAREMGTEQLATISETIADYNFGLDQEMENATSVGEAARIQAKRQLVTAIATVVGGGSQATVAVGINKVARALENDDARENRVFNKEQSTIDNLNKAAEESKVKPRPGQTFKQFVDEVAPDSKVYVDGAQATLYMQSISNDPDADVVLKKIKEQIEEAERLNGEVEFDASDFMNDIAGSEHYEALRPHMSMSVEGISPFRKESEQQQRMDHFAQVMNDANIAANEEVEVRKIFDSATARFEGFGTQTHAEAQSNAEVYTKYFVVKAKAEGVPIETLFSKLGLSIAGPYDERKSAVAAGARKLFEQYDFKDSTISEEKISQSTGEKTVTERPAKQVFDKKTKQRTISQKLLDCLNS